MYKNMPELLEERENNGWKLEKMVLCLEHILD